MANNSQPPNPADLVKERRPQRSIRLPASMWLRLDALAKTHGATVTALVEDAVRRYLAALDSKRRE